MKAVVDDVDDLTPAWLSYVLDLEVRSVTAERVGSGQTGAAFRLTIDGDGTPPTVVAKLGAGDEEARHRVRDGYRKEVGFYAHLVDTVEVRTPHCWYAAIAEDAHSFTLVLEDLAPRVPGVQVDGCSLDHAADAVGNLAALHASRWNDASLFDVGFLERPTEAGAAFLGRVVAGATGQFVRRYGADLDAGDVATLRASATAVTAWQLARPEPFVLLHGDYRLDNLLFPSAGDGDGAAIVDWQTLAVGPPGRDLAYFLGTSLSVEDRRTAERDLVSAYHAALVARGVDGYDADRCFDDYRLGQLQGPLVTTIGCIYSTAQRSEPTDAMFLAMARRCCTAIRELGSLNDF